MEPAIKYLNTDLDLASSEDLTALAAALETRGLLPLHVLRDDDGVWTARFETDEEHAAPESNIAAFLAVIDSLDPELRLIWQRCASRELNIGYDFGPEPWAFNQHVSSEILGRMGGAGVSLRITLYPAGDTHGT